MTPPWVPLKRFKTYQISRSPLHTRLAAREQNKNAKKNWDKGDPTDDLTHPRGNKNRTVKNKKQKEKNKSFAILYLLLVTARAKNTVFILRNS